MPETTLIDTLLTQARQQLALGDAEQGIKLIEQGIAKGGLKRPEDAKLRLGLAQLQQPKTKAAGVQTLKGVKGTDGVADIARLWLIVGN